MDAVAPTPTATDDLPLEVEAPMEIALMLEAFEP
jgi:hypothetical protein